MEQDKYERIKKVKKPDKKRQRGERIHENVLYLPGDT